MKLVPTLLACVLSGLGFPSAQGKLLDFDHLRRSVIRIQAVSARFDWLHPFRPGEDGVGLGSGFVVQTTPYPLFVTNQHVINDAKQVVLQLLLYGEQQWEADVVAVCPKFDIALLVLKNPKRFNDAMTSRNISLGALQLSDTVAAMGEDVVALGFPLGQDALKISKGNIAGNEEVDGNICIQSTAPISPGNSGGPLLNADGSKVVGINFAKAPDGENINYVIPAWRVRQMINKHLKDQPEIPANGAWKRLPFEVPMHELTTIEANEALYTLSGGCTQGIYVAKIGQRSFFHKANPPVTEGSFLVSVNGVDLDRFGMGANPAFAADLVVFPDLFFMVPDVSAGMRFQTCSGGKTISHKVSMAWSPEYNDGITYVAEPTLSGRGEAFEMFGDISVMEMTINHISAIISGTGDPGPARWLHPDYVAQPRLIVNFVRQGSYPASILWAGDAVEKVNGHKVRTLKEFHQHFIPENASHVWTLETDTGRVCALMFNKSLKEQLHNAQVMKASYLLTPSIVNAGKLFGLVPASSAGPVGSTVPVTVAQLTSNNVTVKTATPKVRGANRAALASQRSLLLEAAEEISIGGVDSRAAGPLLVRKVGPNMRPITRDLVPRIQA